MLIFPSAIGKYMDMQNYKVTHCSLVYNNTRLTTSQMAMNRELVIYIILYSYS